MMYRAWGIETGKTYLEAETKADLWKLLQLKFPTYTKKNEIPEGKYDLQQFIQNR